MRPNKFFLGGGYYNIWGLSPPPSPPFSAYDFVFFSREIECYCFIDLM